MLRRVLLLPGLLAVACASPAAPPAGPIDVCGDGLVDAPEECDDANTNDADGCLRTCLKPARFVASDPHIHSNGCRDDVKPEALLALSANRGIEVTAALVFGEGYSTARRYFTGRDSPASRPGRLIHYDMEISHFPAAETGHLVLLGLSSIRFSADPFRRPQSGIPVADWALAQSPRVVVGMAHGQFWPDDGRFPSPPVDCCMPWDFVPQAVRGRMHFLETERTGPGPPVDAGTLRLWSAVQNAGFRVALAGASDFSCIHHLLTEQTPRTDVLFDGEISYDRWLEALRAGRTSVAVGRDNRMNLRVDGVGPGGQLAVAAGETLRLSVETSAPLPHAVQILANGQAVGSLELDAGRQARGAELRLERSAWLSAVNPWVMTSPVYVLVDGRPIRGPAGDICYLMRYLDHLTNLARQGRIDMGPETGLALADYAEARNELDRRFIEAGGTTCF